MVNKIQVSIKTSSVKVTLEQGYTILFLEGQCPADPTRLRGGFLRVLRPWLAGSDVLGLELNSAG